MRRPIPIIIAILLALGAIEGVAYWWMHPKPAGLGEPVLVYRPQEVKAEKLNAVRAIANSSNIGEATIGLDGVKTEMLKEKATAQSSSTEQQSTISSSSTTTLLSDVVAAALPSLRCTTGTAARIDREDDVTIHVAFFEWDLSSSTNVLEAFKHLPEQCMGSIGMTLIEKAPPRSYVVRGQGAGDRGQEDAQASLSASSSYQQSSINNLSRHSAAATDHQSEISSSAETISFDHTVFRDQRGAVIHAFKGTWVSGASNLLGDGLRGGEEQWRQLRWRAALKRFRPAHARVVQGAVRGIPHPDLAWDAFEEAMLGDLRFATP